MSLRTPPGVLRFVGVARKYCEVLETSASDREAWLESVLRALAALYSAALGLPEPIVESNYDAPEGFHMQYDEWLTHWNRLGEILGNARYHWAYCDPTEPSTSSQEPIIHDLADDLADIYGDVRSGLRVWDTIVEGFVPAVIWQWRFSFQNHWGSHAVSALRALHNLAYYRGLGPSFVKVDNA